MAGTFNIKYKTRLKLQRAIQNEIKKKGLTDTWDLYNSVRVSSATGDLNKLYITVNALYYYMFLDKGADLWNGGAIARQYITKDALRSTLGLEFQQEAVNSYIEWMVANYPILDIGKITVEKLNVVVRYNLFGDPDGSWNGTFDANL